MGCLETVFFFGPHLTVFQLFLLNRIDMKITSVIDLRLKFGSMCFWEIDIAMTTINGKARTEKNTWIFSRSILHIKKTDTNMCKIYTRKTILYVWFHLNRKNVSKIMNTSFKVTPKCALKLYLAQWKFRWFLASSQFGERDIFLSTFITYG